MRLSIARTRRYRRQQQQQPRQELLRSCVTRRRKTTTVLLFALAALTVVRLCCGPNWNVAERSDPIADIALSPSETPRHNHWRHETTQPNHSKTSNGPTRDADIRIGGSERNISRLVPNNVTCLPARPDDRVLRWIRLSQIPSTYTPRILCFLMTHQGNHRTRVSAILDTWGPRCDKLVIVTNSTDGISGRHSVAAENDDRIGTNIDLLLTNTAADYRQLWPRLQEVMVRIWDTYGRRSGVSSVEQTVQTFDWFYKLDDDTYVIMDNLKAFLASPNIHRRTRQGEPLVYGHAFSLGFSQKKKQVLRDSSVGTPIHDYRESFWTESADTYALNGSLPRRDQTLTERSERPMLSPTNYTNRSTVLLYASGGAGYVMNRAYVRAFVDTTRTYRNDYKADAAFPEDMSHFLIMHHFAGIRLQSSRDELGRERFHYREPYKTGSDMYRESWEIKKHKAIGGMLSSAAAGLSGSSMGPDRLCCSTNSIAFHYVDPTLMRYIDRYLYHDATGSNSSDEHATCEDAVPTDA